ncbi:MAG: amidohydrolase family protein [Actinomycetota bacterium]
MTIVLANALLADGRLVDVTIEGDRIASVLPAAGGARPGADDLHGMLLLPAMAEPHAHLDKALTAEVAPNPDGDLLGAIDAWTTAAASGVITPEGIIERASQALDRLLLNGVTAVRSHVNVGDAVGVVGIEAMLAVRERYTDLLDLQIVGLSHCPMSGTDGAGNRAALRRALELGIDVLGGCPHLDPDPHELIRVALDLAGEFGVDVDLHMDETLNPEMFTLPDLARQVLASGFAGRVAASHCVSLSVQPPEVQQAVAEQLAAAGVAVFPLPQTNLFLQGRAHPTHTPRAITPIDLLRRAGVQVAAGADNVQDPFNPVGRSDPLETAALAIMAAHQLPEAAYQLVSNDVRVSIGLEAVTIDAGSPAELVAIVAPSIRAAIADAPADRRVYHRGRLVAATTTDRCIFR